jgi:hypothetical protein
MYSTVYVSTWTNTKFWPEPALQPIFKAPVLTDGVTLHNYTS